MRKLLIPILLIIGHSALGQFHYDLTDRSKQAIDKIFKLKLNAAGQLLEVDQRENPKNLVPVFLKDYIEFFRVYITEDELLYFDLMDHRKERLEMLEKGPQDSPWHLYCLAEVYIHWAINRLKFEEYMGAFMNVRKAYHLLEANRQKFPEFVQNMKSLAVMHMVVGSIPEEYKWGADILGLEGSVQLGMEEFETLVDHCEAEGCLFEREVMLLEAFLKLHLLKNEEEAWQLVTAPGFVRPDDLLSHFAKASIASYTGRNEEVINVVGSAPQGPAYINFQFMDYLMGMALVRKLDPSAKNYLRSYATTFGGRNYIKECWQKLAWICLVEGDTAGYQKNMEQVKEQGYAIIDEDKVAMSEAKLEEIPNPLLIKARLYFDGGYHEKALNLLKGKSVEDFSSTRDQLEFTYRAGRIYQEMGDPDLAKRYYYATLKNAPGDVDYYFAPNASLQLGLIFEEMGDSDRASYFFKKAVNFQDHAYENGIESQAKAGLKRLER